MRLRSLVAFWVLSVLVSGGAGTVVAVSDQSSLINGVGTSNRALTLPLAAALALLLVSGSGPAIAAILVSAVEGRWNRVRALLRQVLDWRAPFGWYVVALIAPFALTVLATVGWAAITGGRPSRLLPVPTPFQVMGLPIFPWGEEIGWRGF